MSNGELVELLSGGNAEDYTGSGTDPVWQVSPFSMDLRRTLVFDERSDEEV